MIPTKYKRALARTMMDLKRPAEAKGWKDVAGAFRKHYGEAKLLGPKR